MEAEYVQEVLMNYQNIREDQCANSIVRCLILQETVHHDLLVL